MLLVRRFYPKRLTYSILWAIPTGAIWGEVYCPGTQQHADCSGVWTCDPLIPTPRLYPLRHTPPGPDHTQGCSAALCSISSSPVFLLSFIILPAIFSSSLSTSSTSENLSLSIPFFYILYFTSCHLWSHVDSLSQSASLRSLFQGFLVNPKCAL